MLFLVCFPRENQLVYNLLHPWGGWSRPCQGMGEWVLIGWKKGLPGGRLSSLLALLQLQGFDWNVMSSSITVPLNWSRTDLQTEC
jgi:hypothetical protein